jgi:large subunit ribosomal protein L5e
MPFVKQQKTKAYFKRYQVKYRRRREGKTDYYARKRLVTQAKNKYNTPKYRLVVRFTNKDITVQVVYSKLNGDYILSAAYAHELPRYGIKVGLTNWSAAYAVGLLAARRVLQKLGLDSKYEGNTSIDGNKYDVEPVEDGPRPFKVYLDVGLRRTTTGARVFGVLKGAADGGIYIPHSENRFPGYDAEAKTLDAEVLKKYIYGGHVCEYMEELQENDEEAYKKHFAKFIEEEIEPDDLEEMYQKAHEAIRADPVAKKSEREPLSAEAKAKLKQYKQSKLTLAQRKERIAEKKKAFLAAQEKTES